MRLLPYRSLSVKLILISLMHFVTDGLCSYLIFAKLYHDNPDFAFFVFLGYNVLAFVTQSPIGMLIDKYKAKKNLWRIRESTLLLIAVIGGSIGALAGMYTFRHKTKHLKFTLGIPVILVLQIVAAYCILTIK